MEIYEEGSNIYEEKRNININSQEILAKNDLKTIIEILFEESTPEIYKIVVFGNDTDIVGYYAKDNKSLSIPFGRFFSDKELKGGRFVLLSDAFLSKQNIEFLENMLEQSIQITDSDEECRVIGRYNSTIVKDLFLSQEICIPFETYVEMGVPTNEMKIVFTEDPEQKELEILQKFFHDNLSDISVELPNVKERKAIILFFSSVLSHFIIFIVFYITIFNIFSYWIKLNIKKLYI